MNTRYIIQEEGRGQGINKQGDLAESQGRQHITPIWDQKWKKKQVNMAKEGEVIHLFWVCSEILVNFHNENPNSSCKKVENVTSISVAIWVNTEKLSTSSKLKRIYIDYKASIQAMINMHNMELNTLPHLHLCPVFHPTDA